MGIEDRDYYRENYAKKSGMHYNARNATYSRADKGLSRGPNRENLRAHEFGSVAKALISVAVALVCLAVWRYLR